MKTIFLLRKPPEGNLVKNTLTHGCGGLNIDATRISGVTWATRGNGESYPVFDGVKNTYRHFNRRSHENGLYSANLLLSHLTGCGDNCVEGCPIKKLDEDAKKFKNFREG